MRVLTDSTVERQPPVTGPIDARSFICPWRPIVVLTRFISSHMRSFSLAIALKRSAISASSGSSDIGSLMSNSPSSMSRIAASSRRRSMSRIFPSGARRATSCSVLRAPPSFPSRFPLRVLPPPLPPSVFPFFRREREALEGRSELSSVSVSSVSIVSPISTTYSLCDYLGPRALQGHESPTHPLAESRNPPDRRRRLWRLRGGEGRGGLVLYCSKAGPLAGFRHLVATPELGSLRRCLRSGFLPPRALARRLGSIPDKAFARCGRTFRR